MRAKGIEALWSCPEMNMTLLDTKAIGGMPFALHTKA
jgi:hypothetical protein